MKTIGLIPSQKLASLGQDDNGNWLDVPEWQSVVPLIKLPQPSIGATQKATPYLEWFDDRVERRWLVDEKQGAELVAALRKVWASKEAFWSEFTEQEQLGIITSAIPGIKLLDRHLVMWSGEVWSDDERVAKGLDGLVATGIITAERKSEITKNNET